MARGVSEHAMPARPGFVQICARRPRFDAVPAASIFFRATVPHKVCPAARGRTVCPAARAMLDVFETPTCSLWISSGLHNFRTRHAGLTTCPIPRMETSFRNQV